MQKAAELELEIPTECAVCMLLIVRPTQLPCKHVFCQGCAKLSMNFKWECPYCRYVPPKNFKFPLSTSVQEIIKGKDPEAWEARDQQVKASQKEESKVPEADHDVQVVNQAIAIDDPFELEIKFGNRHKLLTNAPIAKNGRQKNHEWTCYVTINTRTRVKAQEVFKSVMFILPACYQNRYREVVRDGTPACRDARSYFECKEATSGAVNVQMEIKFREDLGINMPAVRLQHVTAFKSTGESKIHKVQIPRAFAEELKLCARRE